MIEEKKKINRPLIYAILGVTALVLAVSGSAYAYYAATAQNNTDVTGTAGGGAEPTLTIEKTSTGATGELIPIDMDTATLTSAAKATTPCKDKNGYTACQIYKVEVKNNANMAQAYNINLTSLTGGNVPNIEAVTMGTSSNTVASVTSIKANGSICTTNSVAAGQTTTACYFMVFIKNLNSAQSDKGSFTGTVTATSTTGAQTKADFS